ncbi:hypothetical protein [Streptomyces cinereospinus]|uniref:Universal stress protein n=1 Tax=Streptomyces cinereospinus TaxID=285561 RepID=A0ABV5N8X0_9ACTN
MAHPVVVGVDGSPSSPHPVEIGARVAGPRGVGLRLVHAFGGPSMPALLGSVGQAPLRHAHCPVAVVRGGSRDADRP